jgi:predicted regulator of Ras-like GTPase activity (Roadblock/LC7/MglB family)
VDEIRATLEACRGQARARIVVLVGRDGLIIDQATGPAPVEEVAPAVDDELAAAEATELLTVADRLFTDALATAAPEEIAAFAGDAVVRLRRLAAGDAVMLVLPAGADPGEARAALDAAAPRLDEALA